MDALTILDELQTRAKRDHVLCDRLLNTKNAKNPLQEFCRIAGELGYELYPMDVIVAGEEFYASMRRSTNGGGENAPMLDGEDDFYEMFLAGIKEL